MGDLLDAHTCRSTSPGASVQASYSAMAGRIAEINFLQRRVPQPRILMYAIDPGSDHELGRAAQASNGRGQVGLGYIRESGRTSK